MLIQVPTEIDPNRILWEGILEPEEDAGSEIIRGIRSSSSSGNIRDELPVVSIGNPLVSNIVDHYEQGIPQWLQSKLDNGFQFYLVRFACSFRPRAEKFQFSQAIFVAQLNSDQNGNRPIAVDLCPLEVNQEIQRDFTVTLSPSLKFKQVQGSLGSADFGLQYPELQPMIFAAGVGGSKVSWDYQRVKGRTIQGSKIMHLLLQIPREMQKVRTKMKVQADLEDNGNFITKLFLPNRNTKQVDYHEVDLLQYI